MQLAIRNTGLVSSVGLSAPATCAAIRAGLANPSETRFIDSAGDWIRAHCVPLERPWVGLTRLAKMAAMAVNECLAAVPRSQWPTIPVMLCVAERERPGRAGGLNEKLLAAIEAELGSKFAEQSLVVPQGRVSVAVSLDRARRLIYEEHVPYVLVVAADSLLNWATLSHYERNGRLLSENNSNGFIAGEGAGALLVCAPSGAAELICSGIGLATERAHIDSEAPLRADGLAQAASLALARTLREHKDEFPIWHPAESIGEQGATVGTAVLALADAACRKSYSSGPRILAHMANDTGQRAALALEFVTPP
jgi:3-oxoacyl-[acyl-carrier-protein] synthase-1